MITARSALKPPLPGRSGAAIGSHPIAELRVRAHKSAAHIGADRVVIVPLAVCHVPHTNSPILQSLLLTKSGHR